MTKMYFSHFWRLEVQDQSPAGLGSGVRSLPGLQMATFLLCPYMAFLLVFDVPTGLEHHP